MKSVGWAQRRAELSRVVPLLTRVVPALWLARRRGAESILHAIYARAAERPAAPAVLFADSRTSYADLVARVDRCAAWLEGEGIRAGDRIALIGFNSLDYVVGLLALARLGAPAALPSPELDGALLTRALERAGCRAVLVEAGLAERIEGRPEVRVLKYGDQAFRAAVERAPARPTSSLPAGGEADFAYVYTSGTTGLSKPCRVSHRRALLAAVAFSRLVHGLEADDVVYCPLPLHHSSPLLLGLAASLVSGAALALRPRFSASALLEDVRAFEATVLLYVGELGRAWVMQPARDDDRRHRLRLLVGNGMHASVWAELQRRFGVPEVREFYAASEFPGAIVNLTGKVGSLGHLPLARLRGYRLVRVDAETAELLRDAQGRAILCADDEPGELVLALRPRPGQPTGDYLGYHGEPANADRIARDLFVPGDVYCRSGDLLRRDAEGYYYFVDRLGDTFRFKSENVSTREVEEAFTGLPEVRALLAVGVRVPGFDGKLGLLVLEAPPQFSVEPLAARLAALPAHARPCFVRIVGELPVTSSLKYKRAELARHGVDPQQVSDPLYYREKDAYRPLDASAFARIVRGELRF